MRKKLAIVGFSERSRDFAPYDDPEWEIWGCNHVYRFVPRVDVLFEIHRLAEVEVKLGPEKWADYSAHLRDMPGITWMQDESPEFPKVKRLPIEELEKKFSWQAEHVEFEGMGAGTRKVTKREVYNEAQFKSTLSYMLCMALREKRFEEIAIYGVDMRDDSEWHFQRMNFSFFLGWARGAGVKITIPEVSALLREAGWRRYGYETGTAEKYREVISNRALRVKELDAKLKAMDDENEGMVARISEIHGAMKLADEMAANESFNGYREVFVGRKAALQQDLRALMEKQRLHLLSMMEHRGARNEDFALMEFLGYHNRGEMPEGRA